MEREKVLLVDDEPLIVIFGKCALEMQGYEVTTSSDSAEAMSLLMEGKQKFDLLITDQNMPKITGMELSQMVKKITPDLPIILITGDFLDSKEELNIYGISAYCQKPFSYDRLSRVVRDILDKA